MAPRALRARQDAILGIAGDVRATELIAKLEKWLAGWKRPSGERSLATRPGGRQRAQSISRRPAQFGANDRCAGQHRDRPPQPGLFSDGRNEPRDRRGNFAVVSQSPRRKGYTYGVYSDFSALRYPGPWRAGGNMRTEVTEAGAGGVF